MNREILYRGQVRKPGEKVNLKGENLPGEWVYGGVFQGKGDFSIIYGWRDEDGADGEIEKFVVYTDTLGEYTGLKDKNGRKIFEGDIIKTHYANACNADFIEQVVFHNGKFCAMYKLSDDGMMLADLANETLHPPQDKTPYMEWCLVLGCIHDHPEFLKEESSCT